MNPSRLAIGMIPAILALRSFPASPARHRRSIFLKSPTDHVGGAIQLGATSTAGCLSATRHHAGNIATLAGNTVTLTGNPGSVTVKRARRATEPSTRRRKRFAASVSHASEAFEQIARGPMRITARESGWMDALDLGGKRLRPTRRCTTAQRASPSESATTPTGWRSLAADTTPSL